LKILWMKIVMHNFMWIIPHNSLISHFLYFTIWMLLFTSNGCLGLGCDCNYVELRRVNGILCKFCSIIVWELIILVVWIVRYHLGSIFNLIYDIVTCVLDLYCWCMESSIFNCWLCCDWNKSHFVVVYDVIWQSIVLM